MSLKFVLTAATLLALLAMGCKRQQEQHLGWEEMQKVLVDIQLAEVYSTMARKDSAQTQGLKNTDSLASFYQEVLTHHHITAEQFIQSLNWYRAHPDQLDSVFAKSLKTLELAERKK